MNEVEHERRNYPVLPRFVSCDPSSCLDSSFIIQIALYLDRNPFPSF